MGKIKGRNSDKDITIFKSLGIGMEDLASAYLIYNKAKEQNIGTTVEPFSAFGNK
jgi:ornithine cyclodeaminase/alanine dehydrogenase-like protein (mu-crystallin family)